MKQERVQRTSTIRSDNPQNPMRFIIHDPPLEKSDEGFGWLEGRSTGSLKVKAEWIIELAEALKESQST